jgi:hypothetical protein
LIDGAAPVNQLLDAIGFVSRVVEMEWIAEAPTAVGEACETPERPL